MNTIHLYSKYTNFYNPYIYYIKLKDMLLKQALSYQLKSYSINHNKNLKHLDSSSLSLCNTLTDSLKDIRY